MEVDLQEMNASQLVSKVTYGALPLFYLVPPSQSSFQSIPEVPDYVLEALPYFFILIFLETVIRWLQRKPLPRLNDSINSISAGAIEQLSILVTGTVGVASYAWIYEHWRLADLPWDSALTWWLAFFGVDCLFYWFHRMAHEVNLFWAAHQVHHSSEDYTLSTALRQSALQRFTSWFFYLPMALVVPPSTYIVHRQFNLLYQFWIHTEVIDRLGPLEWILNTPSHHRVHHGRNPYCIDKNYAGVLIIWDRMFGTFQPESEKVVYGLVHPLSTWDPLWAQIHHLVYMFKTIWSHKGLKGKISFLFKGPGWSPGKPRLGCIEDIPHISGDEPPYDTVVPLWVSIYCSVHFLLVVHGFNELARLSQSGLPYLIVVAIVAYLIFTLNNFGLIFDLRQVGGKLEVLRLSIHLLVDWLLIHNSTSTGLPWLVVGIFRLVSVFSLALWITIAVKESVKEIKVKVQ